MDWITLLAALKSRGWTQELIAEQVGSSQSAISDLQSGKTANPSYSVGRGIEALHASRRRPAVQSA